MGILFRKKGIRRDCKASPKSRGIPKMYGLIFMYVLVTCNQIILNRIHDLRLTYELG